MPSHFNNPDSNHFHSSHHIYFLIMASHGEALALQVASESETSLASIAPQPTEPKQEVVFASPKEIALPEQRGSEATRDLKCKPSPTLFNHCDLTVTRQTCLNIPQDLHNHLRRKRSRLHRPHGNFQRHPSFPRRRQRSISQPHGLHSVPPRRICQSLLRNRRSRPAFVAYLDPEAFCQSIPLWWLSQWCWCRCDCVVSYLYYLGYYGVC